MTTTFDVMTRAPFGDLLRDFRAARRVSQFELALRCEVSPRHLSFVETGKAQPGRELVDRLGEELDLSLRERNALHLAAGYAPRYRETRLDAPEMGIIREAIQVTLAQQEPFPAFVLDNRWNILMANRGWAALLMSLGRAESKHINLLHRLFDPGDMRPVVGNWNEVAGTLLRHLRHEVLRSPWDLQASALLDEILAYPNLPADWKKRKSVADPPSPILRTIFAGPDGPLSFLSTTTHFGTAWDLTIEQVRIEAMHPTDPATRDWCRALTETSLGPSSEPRPQAERSSAE